MYLHNHLSFLGKYFIGWSLEKDGSVQWGVNAIIEPKYIKGNTTLYAVYSDTPPKLSDMVSVGDFVDYPAEYTNVEGYESISTGWRVLSVEEDTVRLVSAGVPLTYYNRNQTGQLASHAVTDLTTKFLTTNYVASGFIGTLSENFTNDYTDSVQALTKVDIDNLVGTTLNCGTNIQKFGVMIDIGAAYWLAECYEGDSRNYFIYCIHARGATYEATHGSDSIYLGWGMIVHDNNIHYGYGSSKSASYRYSSAANQTCGIRPVVTLNTGLTTDGYTPEGIWKLTK